MPVNPLIKKILMEKTKKSLFGFLGKRDRKEF